MEEKKKRKRGKREEKGERKEKEANLCMERGGKGERGGGAHINVPKSYKTDKSVFYDSTYTKHPKRPITGSRETESCWVVSWDEGDGGIRGNG